jgi:VPDSG-CTERM motif
MCYTSAEMKQIGRSKERFDEKTTLNRKTTTMKKTVLTILGAVALSCALFSQQALADSISFAGGSSSATGASPGSPTITVNFSSGWSVFAGNGVFSGTAGAAATINSYTFSGDGTGAVCTTCAETQWSFTSGGNTYTFTLQSLNNAHTTSGSIAASGVGYAQVNGGAHLLGTWSQNGTGSGFLYGPGFTFVTTTVPDGGSAVALLGVALTGIEGFRRVLRRRSA